MTRKMHQEIVTAGEHIEQAVREASSGAAILPQDAYETIADLKLAPIARLCELLVAGLDRALVELELREDDGSDPAVSIQAAGVHLSDAATAAVAMREALEAAQAAISRTSARPLD